MYKPTVCACFVNQDKTKTTNQQINKKEEEKEITGQYLWWLTMCGCACEKYNFYNQIKFDIF